MFDVELTILLLISWKWISQTLSTTSSLSNVTKAKPEKNKKTSSIKSYGIKHLACVWRPCNRVNLNALKSRERRRVWGHQRVALGTFLSRWWPRQTGGFSRDKFIKGFVPPLSLGLGGGLTRASKERERVRQPGSVEQRQTQTCSTKERKEGSLTYHLANDDDDLLSGNENI